MSNMRAKYEEMKASYDSKVAQLHKVKMHNVALLNMASGVGGSGKGEANAEQVQRLTELLEAEKSRTKMLMERIEVGANLLPDRTSHAQLFPLLIGRGSNCKMARYTIFSFFNQIIYLESCKKCMYNAIMQHKPVLHVYFYNIRFL